MEYNSNGFKIDSYNEIFENKVNKLKNIYGQDINIDQNTQDGQLLAIEALAVSENQEQARYTYTQIDPDFAEGVNLDRLLKLVGKTRKPATKSNADIKIIINSDVILPASFELEDTNGQKWILPSEKQLSKGEHLITFQSSDWGKITASANTINKCVENYLEIDSVTNPSPAIVGQDEESDQKLRQRRQQLIESSSRSTVGSLIAKLFDIEDVIDADVHENATSQYNAELDLPPYTMWVIVKGGTLQEIAKAIVIEKTGGTPLKGEIEVEYEENFTSTTGASKKIYHYVKFDRPKQINIYIKFNVKKRNKNNVINFSSLKNSLLEQDFSIGQNITTISLYSILNTFNDNLQISDLLISRDNEAWEQVEIEAKLDEEFTLNEENITITELLNE